MTEVYGSVSFLLGVTTACLYGSKIVFQAEADEPLVQSISHVKEEMIESWV